MLKLNTILAIVSFIFFYGNLFSQQQKVDFKISKTIPDGKVVYFDISGIKDNDQSEELVKVLSKIDGVSFCRIFKSPQKTNVCQLNINNSISADYIRAILISNETDFDLNSVTVVKINGIEKRRDGMPEHYPVYQGNGELNEDLSKFNKEKEEWALKYPDEVKALREGTVLNSNNITEPKYIDTGNPKKDAENYDNAKQEWYKMKNNQKK